jgi:beta-catenin-like protein 1
VRGGGAARLAGLLSHENADIALSVVEVIHELTDEDPGDDADEDDESDEVTRDEALRMVVDCFVR